MTLPQSILSALFCMAVVFIMLIALWAAIRIFTVVLTAINNARAGSDAGGANNKS